MAILLTGIHETAVNTYRLDFLDEGTVIAFTFVYRPERRRFEGNSAFLTHFEGRTSGREALVALGKAIAGREVQFPVELRFTGTSNRF